ncbi:MAG: metal-dependent transcriptional regulator [Desulfobacterales bacterium]|nr:metal-dependent transcriptional regulator [Desulfobacterales bacterium]
MRPDTVEDYLKAIYELQEKYGRAKTSALSVRLGVTPGSVTDMLKRLAGQTPRLVRYQPHQGVTLTDRGNRRALAVIRRHRLLETFLHDVLGFSWDEVHAEAEKLEHCLSERLTEALANYLNHPACDPHGDPIPSGEGEIQMPAGCPLSELPAGQPLLITRVRLQDREALQYLARNRIRIGAVVTIVEKSPLDGQISLTIRRGRKQHAFSIGAAVAADIEARPS